MIPKRIISYMKNKEKIVKDWRQGQRAWKHIWSVEFSRIDESLLSFHRNHLFCLIRISFASP